MTEIKNKLRKFTKGLVKAFLFTAIFIFLLLAGIIVSLQIPLVQTKVVRKVSEYISSLIHHPIDIKAVNIHWFDELVLEDAIIYDTHNNEMISVKELVADYSLANFLQGNFTLDHVRLHGGKVEILIYEDGRINIQEFTDSIISVFTGKIKDTTTSNFAFTVKRVDMEDMTFRFHDFQEAKIPIGFDYYHFTIDKIFGEVHNMKISADTFFRADVKNLNAIELSTGLVVHKVNTNYSITPKTMEFKNLYAEIGESIVGNYLRFEYEDIVDLADFNTKINITARAREAKTTSQNLANFAPPLSEYNDAYKVSGNFKGKVADFSIRNLDLNFGEKSRLRGTLRFDGMPDYENAFYDLDFNSSYTYPEDLKQYLGPDPYAALRKFGKISGNGSFTGFLNDFVAKGNFHTALGKVESDVNLKIFPDKTPSSYYKGSINTKGFDLGKLVGYPQIVQLIDMEGKIEGHGFTLDQAETKIDAAINRIGINNYNYRNVSTNAILSKSLFDGKLSIKDTNLVLDINGKVDLSPGKDIFNISAHLVKANLKELNLSPIETFAKTDLKLDFTGRDIDLISGSALFKNTYLIYKNNHEVYIDSLTVISQLKDNERKFDIISDLATLSAKGNFQFTTLTSDIIRLYEEYQISLRNNPGEIARYYSLKDKKYDNYHIDFTANLADINSILSIYFPGLYLSKGTKIDGDFTNGYTSIFNLNTTVDSIYFKENEIFKNQFQIAASKTSDSSKVLCMFFAKSKYQKLNGLPKSENLFTEGIWNGNEIDFSGQIYEINSKNNIKLNGTMELLDNKQLIRLENSTASLLSKVWKVSQNNRIFLENDEITFENFIISNNKQRIELEGTLSDHSNKEIKIQVTDFFLETLNPLLSEISLKGLLSGTAVIKDIYKDLNINGNVFINDFIIDNFLIGNVIGSTFWDNEKNLLGLNVEVERLNNIVISVKGNIKPSKEEGRRDELDLVASMDKADLEMLSPLFKDIFSDISGKVTGDFKITGSFNNVIVKGKGNVFNGRFKIDYTQSTYYFSDNIIFDENLIGFKKLKLRDVAGSIAIVDGGIYHDGFKDFVVNMKAYMDNFIVLNTTSRDNDLFYGNAIVSGELEVLGTINDLSFNATATSKKGTHIFVPITEYGTMEEQSFISFGNSKSKVLNHTKDIDLSGIKLDFNLDVTPDAFLEIIFDKKTGDILRGNGSGNLKMSIDTRGDFNMFGTYRINKGAYNFTLAGIVNKEFKILPNSSITWSGDPYRGILDITAAYEQNASLEPLIPITDSITRRQPENKRRYPVKVLMDLEGDLMSPNIGLDIKIVRYPPQLIELVTEFESRIKINEQELNKQVFSLLVLRSFSDDSFRGIGGSGGNLSELLSNQLSNWLSQVDQNLQIDIDLNTLDREALNTFQLRFSYSMLDGRLRISRDGSFQNVQNNQNTNNFTSIAGEWTIEYLLTKEGQLRLKLYNKNNNNALLRDFNQNMSTAGFSLMHTQSFNNVMELIKKKKENPPIMENDPKEEEEEEFNEDEEPNKEPELPKDSTVNEKSINQKVINND
ncbi:MAG: translocation/assembly module TamB domain-containing protein [Cytophagaceae bacterium]